MRKPSEVKGETSVLVDGEEKIIRMSLGAQERIMRELGIEQLEEITGVLRASTPRSLCVMISESLVDEKISTEDLLEMHIPTAGAVASLMDAINLALWGNINGPPQIAQVEEEKDLPGISETHEQGH